MRVTARPLTRPQVAGRLHVLRQCLAALEQQAARDGHPAGAAALAVAAEAGRYEQQLQAADRWPLGILDNPAAAARLRRAHGELAEVRAEIGADQHRAVNRRARRLAQQDEQRSESAEFFAAFRVLDDADLASQAPGIYAERGVRYEG